MKTAPLTLPIDLQETYKTATSETALAKAFNLQEDAELYRDYTALCYP